MKIYCKNKLKNDIALMIDNNNIDVELFLNIFKELIFGQLYFAGFFKFSKNIYFSFFRMKKEHSMIEYAGEKK